MHSAERDAGAVSVISRVMEILSTYTSSDVQLSLAEITRRSGLPKPTVHRLLHKLTEEGLLERYGDSGWRLGMRLFELGQMAPRQRGIHEAAAPFLGDLHEATHETVHLGILDGTEVVYIDKLARTGAPELPSRIGGRMPLHCTGIGKAWLAYSPPSLFETIVANGLERRTKHTIIAPGLLAKQLAEVRRRGVAFEWEESTAGVVCVACPVLDEGGKPVAAISISGRANRLDVDRLAPAVRTAALGLARRLRGGR